MVIGKQPRPQRFKRVDYAILGGALIFGASIHQQAFEDRMLLIVYCVTMAGAAYTLLHRRALGLAAVLSMAFSATVLAAAFYAAKPESWHPWIDPIRDMAGLGVLLALAARTVFVLHRYEREEEQNRLRRFVEEKTVELRAKALHSTSHEVRTPLATITALSETLLDNSTGPLNEIQREFVKDIDDAAKHLLALVNDILDFAKAEAGMIQISPEPVAISGLVEQCINMASAKATQMNVQVSSKIDPSITEITADPLRLKQILLNMISNGIKYNKEDGAVNVHVRPDGDHVLFSVRDTGRGISAESLPHLFDPYYQASASDQGIGTGLGLGIVRHLVELHGGSITVESVVDAGTVFRVRLPTVVKVASGEPSDNESVAADEWENQLA